MPDIRRFLTIPALAAALALTVSGPADAASSTDASATVTHPTGATQVVLQVVTEGGFVPPEVNLANVPEYTLLGDGTVIVPGVTTLQYPGPALLPLYRFQLTEKQVQQVLNRARRAGLLATGTIDYGQPLITDVGTTTVTVNAGGRTVTRSAYALSFEDADSGLTSAQVRARTALRDFLADLPQDGSAAGPYVPTTLAVYVGTYSGEADGGTPVVWPLRSDLATLGSTTPVGAGYRCTLVTGKDLTVLLATLSHANSRSPWVMRAGDATRYSLVARPVLPGTQGCPTARR